MSAKYLRAIEFLLTCGHTFDYQTTVFRVTEPVKREAFEVAEREGIFCKTCFDAGVDPARCFVKPLRVVKVKRGKQYERITT